MLELTFEESMATEGIGGMTIYGCLLLGRLGLFLRDGIQDKGYIDKKKNYYQYFESKRELRVYLSIIFPYNQQIYWGIDLNTGPTSLTRLGWNTTPAYWVNY